MGRLERGDAVYQITADASIVAMLTSENYSRTLDLHDVTRAATALNGVVTRTPLLENADVNEQLGGRLMIKAECAQRTGAFKLRGAYNCIRQLTRAEKARGVLTYSSGNHAQGVALAARLLGTSALIVMPSDVPPSKVEATQALGAKIVTFERDHENSDEVVERLRRKTGRVEVPPSGDLRVLAGAGTVALEMYQQAKALDATLDEVLVPCGGGGLTAATAVVMRAVSPPTQTFAVEPELFDDTRRSLAVGQRVMNSVGRRIDITGKTVATVAIGGNIDPNRYCNILNNPNLAKE